MDKIYIKNLKIAGKHGVYDFEKKQNHFFEIDAVIYLSLKKAGKSDNLKDTVDYVEVVNLIAKIFKEKDCKLIEAVAESICSVLLDSYPIKKIKLKIRKPHAPIHADLDTVQVSIIRLK